MALSSCYSACGLAIAEGEAMLPAFMRDPFRLASRLFTAGFMIAGHSFVFLTQSIMYLVSSPQPRERVVEAYGFYANAVVRALGRILED